MNCQIISSLAEVHAQQWDALNTARYPFINYAFLRTLETEGCVGSHSGWYPQYIVAYREGLLVGALPMYLKTHSWGEFVFDFAWAEAYHRSGLSYYPKLVIAVPFSPVTGSKLLVQPSASRAQITSIMIDTAIKHAKKYHISSIHGLFLNQEDCNTFLSAGFIKRLGYQFHWSNQNQTCSSFDDYLNRFNAKQRKNIKRERRRIQEMGVSLKMIEGQQMNEALWLQFYHLYSSTCRRKEGMPYLNLNFFKELNTRMSSAIVLAVAMLKDEIIAMSFFIKTHHTLYGRYWGCSEQYDSLHFETCYYTPIEYCIRNNLLHFDAGAQGEHKISRGFMPVPTLSAHWINHIKLRPAIESFLDEEACYIIERLNKLKQCAPFN